MALNYTYPGIYIQELPSSTHPVTAAPTSIAVFVGYCHPFKANLDNFPPGSGTPISNPVQIFSWADYVREFGGLFDSNLLPADLPLAVYQFFSNGGSVAYVVGVRSAQFTAASRDFSGITFTAKEITDTTHATKVTITPIRATLIPRPANTDVADIVITCGSQTETFRAVKLWAANPTTTTVTDPDFLSNRLASSSLVKVAPTSTSYPAVFPTDVSDSALQDAQPDPTGAFTITPEDFFSVFQQDRALDKVGVFNLLLLPGLTGRFAAPASATSINTPLLSDTVGLLSQALAFCERKRAFFIMDPPPDASSDSSPLIADAMNGTNLPKSPNGALYFPYLKSIHPLSGAAIDVAPSGFVAGIYARTDSNRGVWKAPAGLETMLLNTSGVVDTGTMTDPRQGTLNPIGVNCLRVFPGAGTVVFGARTLVSNDQAFAQWWYVPVRRMALFIEQTLSQSLTWVTFEPNDEPLWVAVRTSVEAFMLSLFRQGAFQGSSPSQAFMVKCDSSTTTQDDIDKGVVNIVVGFRPLKPAEFVVVQITQLAGQVQA